MADFSEYSMKRSWVNENGRGGGGGGKFLDLLF
jgi:hypothetical protein